MTRYFNTEGQCRPDIHYMVRIDERIKIIKHHYVDKGKYFVINKGRQYGKTTTLMALEKYLKNDYIVLFMDFQMMSDDSFKTNSIFAHVKCWMKNYLKKKTSQACLGHGLREVLQKR